MEVYKISHEDMMKWCSIPEDQLVGHPDSKVDLKIFDSRRATMESQSHLLRRGARPSYQPHAGLHSAF